MDVFTQREEDPVTLPRPPCARPQSRQRCRHHRHGGPPRCGRGHDGRDRAHQGRRSTQRNPVRGRRHDRQMPCAPLSLPRPHRFDGVSYQDGRRHPRCTALHPGRVRQAHQIPGTEEKPDALEPFHPDGWPAHPRHGRCRDPRRKGAGQFDEASQEVEKKIRKNSFDFEDFYRSSKSRRWAT